MLKERILSGNGRTEVKNKDEEWQVCVDTVENLFVNRSKDRAYIRDIEIGPEENDILLSNIDSHISLNEEKNIKEMKGINTPMHYIGEKGSFTAHHEEDAGLSSMNLLKWGEPKLWFIIHNKWRAEVENNIHEYIVENTNTTKKKTDEKKICTQVFQHKIFIATPNLLHTLKIPYSIVLQKPGDLFFIRRGTYHAVINLGTNVAEAINYGCDEWNSGYEPLPCPCPENKKNDVVPDRTAITLFKEAKTTLKQCTIDGCCEIFVTTKKLDTHKKMIHHVN